jgi:hypothetical protein
MSVRKSPGPHARAVQNAMFRGDHDGVGRPDGHRPSRSDLEDRQPSPSPTLTAPIPARTLPTVFARGRQARLPEIGSMKMREEIGALRTMGLDPVELLSLPLVIMLVCTLPAWPFWAPWRRCSGGGGMFGNSPGRRAAWVG